MKYQVTVQVDLQAVGKACWQNRPHDGLRDPLTPGRALTPNERYAALIDVAGYVPVPLSPEDYIELLPAAWRVINSYGVKVVPADLAVAQSTCPRRPERRLRSMSASQIPGWASR